MITSLIYPKSIAPSFHTDLLGRIDSELDQFLHEFFNPNRAKKISARSYPKMDMYRNDKDLVIEASVPGITKEQLSISLEGNILSISGESIDPGNNKENSEYFIKELKKSRFVRSFTIPEQCSEPEAELKDGILTLTFKNVYEEVKPQVKVIDIK